MTNQLIEFETAKLAKKKGLKLNYCQELFYPDPGGGGEHIPTECGHDWELVEDRDWYSRPTQTLLQRWLREREIPIVLEVNFGVIDDAESAFTWHIREYVPGGVEGSRKKDEKDFWKHYDSLIWVSGDWFSTYEEALEKGLQRALKLIP